MAAAIFFTTFFASAEQDLKPLGPQHQKYPPKIFISSYWIPKI
jgi:hypothetical protein